MKYYRSKAALEGSKTVAADLAAAGIQTKTMLQINCFADCDISVWEHFSVSKERRSTR